MKTFFTLLAVAALSSACTVDTTDPVAEDEASKGTSEAPVLVQHVHLREGQDPIITTHRVTRAEWARRAEVVKKLHELPAGELAKATQALTNNNGLDYCPYLSMVLYLGTYYGSGVHSCFTGTGGLDIDAYTAGGCTYSMNPDGSFFCSGKWQGSIGSIWNDDHTRRCWLHHARLQFGATTINPWPHGGFQTVSTTTKNSYHLSCSNI